MIITAIAFLLDGYQHLPSPTVPGGDPSSLTFVVTAMHVCKQVLPFMNIDPKNAKRVLRSILNDFKLAWNAAIKQGAPPSLSYSEYGVDEFLIQSVMPRIRALPPAPSSTPEDRPLTPPPITNAGSSAFSVPASSPRYNPVPISDVVTVIPNPPGYATPGYDAKLLQVLDAGVALYEIVGASKYADIVEYVRYHPRPDISSHASHLLTAPLSDDHKRAILDREEAVLDRAIKDAQMDARAKAHVQEFLSASASMIQLEAQAKCIQGKLTDQTNRVQDLMDSCPFTTS